MYDIKEIFQLEKYMTDKEKIKQAVDIAWQYAQIDGSHHKMWVIDQMIRMLLGKEKYKLWVETYETPLDNGDYYLWETGIAP